VYIFAADSVSAIAAFYKGTIISANISYLLGHVPPDATIIANNIGTVADYNKGYLPNNIKIIDKALTDISVIIKDAKKIEDTSKRQQYILNCLDN